MSDYLEARLPLREVDCREIDQHIDIRVRRRFQEGAHVVPRLRFYDHRVVADLGVRFNKSVRKFVPDELHQSFRHIDICFYESLKKEAMAQLTEGRESRRLSWTRPWSGPSALSLRGLMIEGERSPSAILSCSNMRPSKTDSGRGGQPGM